MRVGDVYDVPLALAADYLDRFPRVSMSEACRAAAWRVTDTDGGWCYVSKIDTDDDLAEVLNRLLPSWMEAAGPTTATCCHCGCGIECRRGEWFHHPTATCERPARPLTETIQKPTYRKANCEYAKAIAVVVAWPAATPTSLARHAAIVGGA